MRPSVNMTYSSIVINIKLQVNKLSLDIQINLAVVTVNSTLVTLVITTLSDSIHHSTSAVSLITIITTMVKVITATAALSSLCTHTVMTNNWENLIFQLNNLNVSVEDTVKFEFLSLNHTLTESTLKHSCTSKSEFDTEFN